MNRLRAAQASLALVLLTVGLAGCGNDAPDEDLAIVSCETIVKDKLRDPSSAEFSDQSASGSGNSWTSTGTVRAKNGFGGMNVMKYTCEVTFDGGSYTGNASVTEN